MASAIMAHYHRGLSRFQGGEGEQLAFQVLESTLMGGAIGFIEANSKTGLDIGIGTMKAPLDLGIAGLGYATALFAPLDKAERDVVSRMAGVASGIFVYRKTSAYVKSKMKVHGETDYDGTDLGEDPVVAAARML
jgi:hypothetical protein